MIILEWSDFLDLASEVEDPAAPMGPTLDAEGTLEGWLPWSRPSIRLIAEKLGDERVGLSFVLRGEPLSTAEAAQRDPWVALALGLALE